MRFILLLIIFGVFTDIGHGCETGYYFDSMQCQMCPSNCSICSSVTSCTVCKVGKYGTDCSSLCSSNCHDNVCNIKSGICLSCEKGYYHDINNLCVPCPDNCTTCSSDKYCFACESGFRGVICNETCFNCQYNTGCDKNSGYCFVNCKEGLSGELCNIKCDPKCKSCERLNEHECISCTDDENGKPCKIECLYRCLKSTCKKLDGSGDFGEYSGNQTCASHCNDTVCNITSKALYAERPNSSTTTTNIGVILGPVIGSVVIILSVCITLVRQFITKRRSFCKNSDDKKSSTSQSNGKSGEANALLQPPTTGEEGKPKTQDVKSDKQTDFCDDGLEQSKGANNETNQRNSEEAAALLPNQTGVEPSITTCSQSSHTSNLVKVTMLDENKRNQEEFNSKEPTVKSLEQTKSSPDGIFQQTKGADLSNTETNQNILEFKELHSKLDRKGLFFWKETRNPAKLTILEIQGTLRAIENKYADMKIHVTGDWFTIEGKPGDKDNALKEMNTEYLKIKELTYAVHKSSTWLLFCTSKQAVKYVQNKLQMKRLVGTWDTTGSQLRVYVNDKRKSEQIKNIILEAILEETVPVETSLSKVLRSDMWGDLLLNITKTFVDKIYVCISEQQEVLIVGTNDAIPKATQLVKDFLWKHSHK